MIHFLCGLLLAIFFTSIAWAAKIMTVPVPMGIKDSSYNQSSSLKLSLVTKRSNYIEFELTPVVADFINIPSPGLYQYLHIEHDEERHSPRIRMISFLCSGEIPVGGEALSDSLARMANGTKDEGDDRSIFISTGRAAENISVSSESKARAKVFDHFLDIYEERINGNDISDVYIPTLINSDSTSAVARSLLSEFFSLTSASVNGCSEKFRNVMQDFMIENIVKAQSFIPGIEIRKKLWSEKYRIRWLLN